MSTFNDTFLKACRKEPTTHTPVWFMRQAGRYQESYRNIRKQYSIKDICQIPEVSAQVTLLPIEEFELDTAIIFSDIMIPLEPMGIKFDYQPGVGPVLDNPIESLADVQALKPIDPATHLAYTGASLKILKKELNVPCIGFCGAPFTLASYMIEGGPSKNYIKLKSFMYNHEEAWHQLMNKLAEDMGTYLNFQLDSGASVVQIFDSWIGILSEADFRCFVMPHTEKVINTVKAVHPDAPVILFGTNTGHLLEAFNETKADVLGVDWKTPMAEAAKIVTDKALQGNLDPVMLFTDWNNIENEAKNILDSMKGRDGYIFNLGHGILPGTPHDHVGKLASFVRDYSSLT